MPPDGADGMGKVTRILVTGASGFLGSAVVAEARSRGIDVVAHHRSGPLEAWATDVGVTPLQADLSDPAALSLLEKALTDVDAVVHCAAHMGSDPSHHAEHTVASTQRVIEALRGKGIPLVLTSSFAVYDYMREAPGRTLREDSPIEDPDKARDGYAEGKIRQELMCREADIPLWVMRIGVIYGPGRSWHALIGFHVWKVNVPILSHGQLPLCHRDHAGWAMVEAALSDPGPRPRVLNVIDDDLPTRARFLAQHRRLAGWPRINLPLPWRIWQGIACISWPLGEGRPGLLKEPILRARLMPQFYDNTALRQTLGGQDKAPFEEMLARCFPESGK